MNILTRLFNKRFFCINNRVQTQPIPDLFVLYQGVCYFKYPIHPKTETFPLPVSFPFSTEIMLAAIHELKKISDDSDNAIICVYKETYCVISQGNSQEPPSCPYLSKEEFIEHMLEHSMLFEEKFTF